MHKQSSVTQPSMETIIKRSQSRKARIVAHRSHSFNEAEDWDLLFWQEQGPEKRLSALLTLHEDLAKVEAARKEQT